MFKLLVLSASVLFISGCASIIASTPDQVIIKAQPFETAKALEIATAECKKQDKRAIYGGRVMEGQLVFDCRK